MNGLCRSIAFSQGDARRHLITGVEKMLQGKPNPLCKGQMSA